MKLLVRDLYQFSVIPISSCDRYFRFYTISQCQLINVYEPSTGIICVKLDIGMTGFLVDNCGCLELILNYIRLESQTISDLEVRLRSQDYTESDCHLHYSILLIKLVYNLYMSGHT